MKEKKKRYLCSWILSPLTRLLLLPVSETRPACPCGWEGLIPTVINNTIAYDFE